MRAGGRRRRARQRDSARTAAHATLSMPRAVPRPAALTPTAPLHRRRCLRASVPCLLPQVVIHSLPDAHEELDKAISAALRHSKHVYICICCNLAGLHHPSFDSSPIPYALTPHQSNPRALEVRRARGMEGEKCAPMFCFCGDRPSLLLPPYTQASVAAAAAFLASKQKPVAVAGSLLRM